MNFVDFCENNLDDYIQKTALSLFKSNKEESAFVFDFLTCALESLNLINECYVDYNHCDNDYNKTCLKNEGQKMLDHFLKMMDVYEKLGELNGTR